MATTALEKYLSRYKADERQDLLYAFRQVRDALDCKRVLYPGCYLHITPSLVFSSVCYVDSMRGTSRALTEPALIEYIDQNKEYPGGSFRQVYQADHASFNDEPDEAFDLLISLNAGAISQTCKRFLKPGQFLLVNDGHHDASRAHVDPDYQLAGFFTEEGRRLETSPAELGRFFKLANGAHLTPEMVESNSSRPPSKARFRVACQSDAYLFRREKPTAS